MIDSRIKGKIIKLNPYSDEWGIFEQYIFIQLLNESIIRVFDYKIIAQEVMVGRITDLVISVFIPEIEKNPSQDFGVHSCIKSIDQSDLRCDLFIFFGKFIGIDEKTKDPIIDIGCGKILISAHKFQIEGIQIGDFLKITARRIDLYALETTE